MLFVDIKMTVSQNEFKLLLMRFQKKIKPVIPVSTTLCCHICSFWLSVVRWQGYRRGNEQKPKEGALKIYQKVPLIFRCQSDALCADYSPQQVGFASQILQRSLATVSQRELIMTFQQIASLISLLRKIDSGSINKSKSGVTEKEGEVKGTFRGSTVL